ncbi:hypothetical protein ACFL2X_03265 [Candidatus Latescibacterota bacterium]
MYDVTALMTAGTAVLSIVKSLSEAAVTKDKAELGGIIIDLQGAVMEMQLKQQELINENRKLIEENRNLTEKIEREKKLEFKHGAYWFRKDDGSLDGPFSQIMLDVESMPVRMKFVDKDNYGDTEKYRFIYFFLDSKKNDKEIVTVPTDFLEKNKVPILEER